MTSPRKTKKKDTHHEFLHAVNSSLAVIWGYTQLLQKQNNLTLEQQDWLQTIYDECDNLKDYIKKADDLDTN